MLRNDIEAWLVTKSNQSVHLTHKNVDVFNINDICWGLSQITRFSGQCNQDYKVAQHCCLVCDLVNEEYKLEGLMHDSAEAYIGDIPTPVKRMIPDIKELEFFLYDQICYKYEINPIISTHVKDMDNVMLNIEGVNLFDTIPNWIDMSLGTVLDQKLVNIWSAETCRYEFMKRFKRFYK